MNPTPQATHPVRRAARGAAGRCHLRMAPRAKAVLGPLGCGEPGAPAWVDFGTKAGTTAAARFYCGLFGWRVVARHRPLEDPVGYWVFQHGGKDVGGLAPSNQAAWTVYIRVADVDATARAVVANGGAVLVGPMTVADAGRLVVCADPLGASFVLWQPDADPGGDDGDPVGELDGLDELEEPGSFPWYQLACPELEVATQFYGSTFGWEARTTPLVDGSCYTELFHPGSERSVAGMVQIDERWSPDVAPQWMVHFPVTNTDRAAARAAELGGTVSVAPFDLPNVGRIAVLNDPENAVFSVLQAA